MGPNNPEKPDPGTGIGVATALPDQQRLPSPKGITLIGDIVLESAAVKKACIKIQSVEHIAKEALCAVLARQLTLPVQQPFYINMLYTEYAGMGNVESIAFGLLAEGLPNARIVSLQGIENKLLKWPDLLKAAVFDEWIALSERVPHKLVYEQDERIWLCDHEYAFPEGLDVTSPINSQLLALIARNKSEFELFKLRNEAMKLLVEFESINWDDIYARLNAEVLPSANRYFDKYMYFLQQRLPELRMIISEDLQIRQSEFAFSHSEKSNIELMP